MDVGVADTSEPRVRQLRDEPQIWAVPNPRISVASTVARTRYRRPDGLDDQEPRKKRAHEDSTALRRDGSVQLTADSHINAGASAAAR